MLVSGFGSVLSGANVSGCYLSAALVQWVEITVDFRSLDFVEVEPLGRLSVLAAFEMGVVAVTGQRITHLFIYYEK